MATHAVTLVAKEGHEPLTKWKVWKALQTHYRKVRNTTSRRTAEAVGLFVD